MNVQEQAWLTRANPASESYGGMFLQEGCIAIGWGEVGDLSSAGYEDIKERIKKYCTYIQSSGQLRIPLSALHHFRNSMHIGDYIFMPDIDSSKIHVGQILGDYYHDETDSLIAHRRKVFWNPSLVLRSRLSEELRSSLQTQRTIANLSRYFQEIADLFDSEEIVVHSRITYSAEYKIRGNQTIYLSGVPKDITPEEAREICTLISGLVRH